MKKDGLKKLYDRLTPEERFNLLIEAVARGDEVECRNLVESCPRLTYEMNDMAYEDLVRRTRRTSAVGQWGRRLIGAPARKSTHGSGETPAPRRRTSWAR